jgi:hypothetical protein
VTSKQTATNNNMSPASTSAKSVIERQWTNGTTKQRRQRRRRQAIAASSPVVASTDDARNTLTGTSFYGAAANEVVSRKRQRFRNETDLGEFVVFPNQAGAFDSADTHNKARRATAAAAAPSTLQVDSEYRVWSFEEPTTGKRRFAAATTDRALHECLRRPTRHWYEIIREASPVRLYFDLEFAREPNPQVDGDALTNILLREVCLCLQKDFGVYVRVQDCLVLESSTESKFSRHVIVHLPGGRLFCDNRHCGRFVKGVVLRLGRRLEVRTKDKGVACFVDCGVYTRNRAFRLYLSSKFGRTVALRPSPSNRFPVNEESASGVRQLFIDALVCPTMAPPALPQQGILLNVAEAHLSVRTGCGRRQGAAGTPATGLGSLALLQRHDFDKERSPAPLLDIYVPNAVQRLTKARQPAAVRSWAVEYAPSVIGEERGNCSKVKRIVYTLARNRFCFNIGRWHKSNHVYYVADLEAREMFQKCLDPECASQGFTSQRWPLPVHLFPRKKKENQDTIDDGAPPAEDDHSSSVA